MPAEGAEAARYREALLSRLEVLTNAELGLFTHGSGDLASLVTAVLAPYGERIRLDHAALVKLSRAQARTFSMLFHELATNATKYGALSVPGGSVHIGWSVSEENGGQLVFDWQEEGGPAAARPAHEGFGTRLMTSLVTLDLAGTIEMHYEASGLRVRIVCPLVMKEG